MDEYIPPRKHVKKYSEYFFRTLTILLVIGMVFIAWPVKVLTDWHFIATPSTVREGGTITLNSSYYKHYNAQADSQRFLECKGPLNSVADYPLVNNYPNYGKGFNHTVTQIVLPTTVPNLPEKCRIYVHTQYILYGIKPVNQENWSNYFQVIK